jgi:hypothetical protein
LRWVGIDEAGYGPNLGPLVMTAIIAESTLPGDDAPGKRRNLDFWGDLAETVDRAGGRMDRLWVDDSKVILRGGKGLDRLEAACSAAIHAASGTRPHCLRELVDSLGAGTLGDSEVASWIEGENDGPPWPRSIAPTAIDALLSGQPLVPAVAPWRIVTVAAVVVGPAQFNRGLASFGSKAAVHYQAFERLLRLVWDRASDGATTIVQGDKHGGRHYYLESLYQTFPETWIERGPEGPLRSRYTVRAKPRCLEINLHARADQSDGLVALASMVSKTVRETWMEVFNRYWQARVPALRATAGYPTDAARFRREIEPLATALGHEPLAWWRTR